MGGSTVLRSVKVVPATTNRLTSVSAANRSRRPTNVRAAAIASAATPTGPTASACSSHLRRCSEIGRSGSLVRMDLLRHGCENLHRTVARLYGPGVGVPLGCPAHVGPMCDLWRSTICNLWLHVRSFMCNNWLHIESDR